MKFLKLASVLIIGVVFIFSGLVKAIDPLGSAYKFHDYFIAFGLKWLDWLSLPLGILLCIAEFLTGFSVLSGIRQKTGILMAGILMAFFTPLTLVLALTNPVSDCGCFGDAIKLTNWQTFGKNIVLLVFTAILFIKKNEIKQVFRAGTEWVIITVAGLAFLLFSLANLRYLPVIDFLPYKNGIRIADQMIIPEGAEPDKYSTTFIYEKNGEQREFTLENYPANDTTWHFIDQKTVLLKKGYVPPIHDLTIVDMNGTDLTNQILADKGYTMLMISKRLDEADSFHLQKGFETGRKMLEKGIAFHVLTASASDYISKFSNGLSFCTGDETTIKTILRANPGYLLIKDGLILNKWSWATLPSPEKLSEIISGEPEKMRPGNHHFALISILALVSLILAILVFWYFKFIHTDNQIVEPNKINN